MKNSRFQEYTGSNFLRQRLVLATITSRSVRISNIRYVCLDMKLFIEHFIYFSEPEMMTLVCRKLRQGL